MRFRRHEEVVMKKVIMVVVLSFLVLFFATGCAAKSNAEDYSSELESLGFTNPKELMNEPIPVWTVTIPNNELLIEVVKADSGWIYDPYWQKDLESLQGMSNDKTQLVMHQFENSPCVMVHVVNYKYYAFRDWVLIKEDGNGGGYYYLYKNSADPIWDPVAANGYEAPGYIPNVSMQTIKDGAVKFFADDPYGNKIYTDDESLYADVYSSVWDFKKGGLKD